MSLPVQRLAMSLMLVAISTISAAQSQRVNPDAQALADFTARVKAYLQLVEKADAGVPPLQETDDPAKIVVAQNALAERIRAVRAGAKPGDIFTPDIQARFPVSSALNPWQCPWFWRHDPAATSAVGAVSFSSSVLFLETLVRAQSASNTACIFRAIRESLTMTPISRRSSSSGFLKL